MKATADNFSGLPDDGAGVGLGRHPGCPCPQRVAPQPALKLRDVRFEPKWSGS